MARKKSTDVPMAIPNKQQIEFWEQRGYYYQKQNIFLDRTKNYTSIFRIESDKSMSMFTNLSKSLNIEQQKEETPSPSLPSNKRKVRSDKGKPRGKRT